MRTFKKILLVLTLAFVGIAVGVIYAPGFLSYSTDYAKADAVVLLLGPDFSARQRHAFDLAKKGITDCLIIPAYNKTYTLHQGILRPYPSKPDKKRVIDRKNKFPRYYEDTHLEILAAKETMKNNGQKSAIFVSSPYHMRRIQLIVDKEFDRQFVRYFSPTPYEAAPLSVKDMKTSDWKKIWREYMKILWFLIYFPWAEQDEIHLSTSA